MGGNLVGNEPTVYRGADRHSLQERGKSLWSKVAQYDRRPVCFGNTIGIGRNCCQARDGRGCVSAEERKCFHGSLRAVIEPLVEHGESVSNWRRRPIP